MSDDDYPATLEEFARAEQEQLWADLNLAVRNANRGCWSIQCEDLAWRIVSAARLVGALSWRHIDVSLLRDGVYERVLTEAGIPYEVIDWDAVAKTEAAILGRAR